MKKVCWGLGQGFITILHDALSSALSWNFFSKLQLATVAYVSYNPAKIIVYSYIIYNMFITVSDSRYLKLILLLIKEAYIMINVYMFVRTFSTP